MTPVGNAEGATELVGEILEDPTDDRLSLYDELLDSVPRDLHSESGEVLYSGRTAFEQKSPVYLLGYNPGGNPAALPGYTISADLKLARDSVRRDWSQYADESWAVFGAGAGNFQRRVLYLIGECGLGDPRRVPASNAIFVRSARVANLDAIRRRALLRSCWTVHQKVIDELSVGVVICLGQDAGSWVRKQLGAATEIDRFTETYEDRHWPSTTHLGRSGTQVVTLTHPSVADWTSPQADPTRLVTNALARDVATYNLPSQPTKAPRGGGRSQERATSWGNCPHCHMELPATGLCGICD